MFVMWAGISVSKLSSITEILHDVMQTQLAYTYQQYKEHTPHESFHDMSRWFSVSTRLQQDLIKHTALYKMLLKFSVILISTANKQQQ